MKYCRETLLLLFEYVLFFLLKSSACRGIWAEHSTHPYGCDIQRNWAINIHPYAKMCFLHGYLGAGEKVSEHSPIDMRLVITTHKGCPNKIILPWLGNWQEDVEHLPLLVESAWWGNSEAWGLWKRQFSFSKELQTGGIIPWRANQTAMGPVAPGLAKGRHPAPLLILGLQREDHLMSSFLMKLGVEHIKLTDCQQMCRLLFYKHI